MMNVLTCFLCLHVTFSPVFAQVQQKQDSDALELSDVHLGDGECDSPIKVTNSDAFVTLPLETNKTDARVILIFLDLCRIYWFSRACCGRIWSQKLIP